MSRPALHRLAWLALAALVCLPTALRAQEAEEAPPVEAGEPEAQAPDVGEPEVEAIDPHGGDPHDGDPHAVDPHGHGEGALSDSMVRAFREPTVARAAPNPELPAGHLRVFVLDEHLHPQIDHEIQLGVMQQGGERNRFPGRTNGEGVYVYEGLPTGSGQAYRVNVPREGATYSSEPFQLPSEHGFDVHVQTFPVTRDDRSVLLVLGQTMVEIKPDERLHIIQQARLSNLAAETYVFPEGGLVIDLPPGFMAFQSQSMMSDQRVSEAPGRGMRIEGSLPNGQVTLAWAFDLPVTGRDMTIELPNPFRTFQYRVIAMAPEGLSLDVDGMPPPVSFQNESRPLLGTEIQRTPSDPPFNRIRMRVRGIPGPSPARLYALLLALLFGAGGFVLLFRRPEHDDGQLGRERRRKELLAEAEAVERDFEAGEIGPETRQSRRAAIVRALAVLFYEEERLGVKPAVGAKGEGSPKQRRAPRAEAGPSTTKKKKAPPKKAPAEPSGEDT